MATKTEPVDDLKTSETPGSLGEALEQQRQGRVYSGHPADMGAAAEPGEGEGGETGAEEGAAGATPGQEPPAGDKEAGATPSGEEPPKAEPKKPEDELPDGWTFQPKYKSQQEAEVAQRAAETKMHTATTEAADLRKENEALRAQLEEAKAGKVTTPPAAPAMTQETFETRLSTALEQIDQLDDMDPEYSKKRGKILAEAYLPLVQGGSSFTADQVQEMISKQINDALQAKETLTEEQEYRRKAHTWYVNKAQEMGLDMAEGSQDRQLFWDLAGTAPTENVTAEDQVKFLVEKVKTYKAGYGATPEAAAQRADALHKKHAVLEKGGSTPPPPPPGAEKFSIGKIMEGHRQSRQI